MKIRTGVISVLTNEVAEQAQGTQEAWQRVAQGKKTIEAQKIIIQECHREMSFLKSQLTAWHLLVDAGIIMLPQMHNEAEDPVFEIFKQEKKGRNIFNPDGSFKKNKLN